MTVEACRAIDVDQLRKAGCLRPGWQGGWEWKRDGERVAWIGMRAEEGRLVLSYDYRRGGEGWQSVEEPVPVVHIPCRFGGTRPYFMCPGAVNGAFCRQRVTKLHLGGRYFLCRHCYRLAYASQSEGVWDRTLRRADKIRRRLGGEPGLAARFPPKPKGMWQRTYKRLQEQVFDAEMRADEVFEVIAERLLARADGPQRKRSFWR